MTDTPANRRSLDEVRDLIGLPAADADLPDIPTPTYWPGLPPGSIANDYDDLREWVETLCRRFEHLDTHVIPRCWWRHNGHVEALAALRDHERASYADIAPATAPVDWLRALRDTAALLAAWTADTGCAAGHHPAPAHSRTVDPDEWAAHLRAERDSREHRDR